MKTTSSRFPSMPQDTLDRQLRFAIANKRLIRVTYKGVVRVVEPHDYGLRDGVPQVLIFQREKAGRYDREIQAWRTFELPQFEECLVVENTFDGTREAAGQRHHRWDVLYARVDHKV